MNSPSYKMIVLLSLQTFIKYFPILIICKILSPITDFLNQVYYILRRILHERFNTQNKSTLSVAQQTELDMFFKSMGPKDYFVGTAAISKKQYRYYLQTFKVVFVSLVQREIVDENLFDAFIQQLGKGRPLTTAASILDGTVWV